MPRATQATDIAESVCSFACTQCDMTFSRKADLVRHAKLHCPDLEELKTSCPFSGCPYRTLQKHNLKIHITAVHMKERPHGCSAPGCDAVFADPAAVIRHERQQHGITRNGVTKTPRSATHKAIYMSRPRREKRTDEIDDTFSTHQYTPSTRSTDESFLLHGPSVPLPSTLQSSFTAPQNSPDCIAPEYLLSSGAPHPQETMPESRDPPGTSHQPDLDPRMSRHSNHSDFNQGISSYASVSNSHPTNANDYHSNEEILDRYASWSERFIYSLLENLPAFCPIAQPPPFLPIYGPNPDWDFSPSFRHLHLHAISLPQPSPDTPCDLLPPLPSVYHNLPGYELERKVDLAFIKIITAPRRAVDATDRLTLGKGLSDPGGFWLR